MKPNRRVFLVAVLLLLTAFICVEAQQVSANTDTETIIIRWTDVYFRPNQTARTGEALPPTYSAEVLERSDDGHWVYVRCRNCRSNVPITGWVPKDATTLDRGPDERSTRPSRYAGSQTSRHTAVFTKPNEPYTHGQLPPCHPIAVIEISADGQWIYQSSEAFVIGWVPRANIALTQAERDQLSCNL